MVEMDRIERLWVLAEIEAGLEHSKLDREPMFGSEKVVNKITEIVATSSHKEYEVGRNIHMEAVGDNSEKRLSFKRW